MRRITAYKIELLKQLILDGYPIRQSLKKLKIGGSTYSRYFHLIWGDQDFQREFYSRRFGFDMEHEMQKRIRNLKEKEYKIFYGAKRTKYRDDIKERARNLAELLRKNKKCV